MRASLSSPASVSLAGAKRRASSRASSGGAVMFVVAMTITVLAALGAWALQSASLEVRMAGYERQNTQTHYISEYGVLAAMQTLNATYAPAILPVAVTGVNGTRAQCLSAPTQNNASASCMAKACFRWSTSQGTMNIFNPSYVNPATSAPYAIDPSAVTGTTPGSFGLTSMQGDFAVEMTEPAQGPAQAGTSGMYFYWVTLTSYGKTQQTTSPNSTALYDSEGDEVLRTRVLAGPIPPLNVTTCP
jgi:Tfp pilus assembly protein PilX